MYKIATIRHRKENSLTKAALDRLLACLDQDPDGAALAYERLRQALIVFFEVRGSLHPEDETDETINRVARRLLEGQLITARSVSSYFYAVARNVWRERLAGAVSETPFPEDDLPAYSTADPVEVMEQEEERRLFERRMECLETALLELPPDEYELIMTYYQRDGRARIEARRALAEQLKISPAALRLKASRIRHKLEETVSQRLATVRRSAR
jgi:RNA polymerase sigma factor (sigma-70 family)